jgi:hypothetical protein
MLKILCFITVVYFAGCSSDSGKIDHARFEIEQGNFESARRYLKSVPKESKDFKVADSLLKAIEK